MYLLLILACVFTIAVILLLNIKDPLQHVFVFLVTLLVFMGFNFLFNDMASSSNIPSAIGQANDNVNVSVSSLNESNIDSEELVSVEESIEESIEESLEESVKQKINQDEIKNTNYLLNPLNNDEYDPAYTPDKIIPNCAYNIGDCTNDLSCIIPPDNANLYGTIKTPTMNLLSKHPERRCKVLPDITIDLKKHCSNCGSLLGYSHATKSKCADVEKVVNNYDRLCVHCKVGVRMNQRDFNGNDLPIEYYPI